MFHQYLTLRLANNPTTSAKTLVSLVLLAMRDGEDRLLIALAGNASLPPMCFTRLAFHRNPEVRTAVADNPHCPKAALVYLACDADADVRYAVAENHNLDEAILSRLAEDDNPYVAHRASTTLRRVNSTNGVVLGGADRWPVRYEDQPELLSQA